MFNQLKDLSDLPHKSVVKFHLETYGRQSPQEPEIAPEDKENKFKYNVFFTDRMIKIKGHILFDLDQQIRNRPKLSLIIPVPKSIYEGAS